MADPKRKDPMKNDEKFEFESIQDRSTIQRYLQALQDGFEKGRIVVNSEGSEIVLFPAGFLKFEVAVKKKGGENKLVIKVGWKEKNENIPDVANISITS